MDLLKNGSEGDDVREIQELLISQGYLDGEADGFFGPLTEGAVLAFQQENGLDATGIVGEGTYNALKGIEIVEEAAEAVEEVAAALVEEEAATEAEEAAEEVAEEAAAEAEAADAGEGTEEAAEGEIAAAAEELAGAVEEAAGAVEEVAAEFVLSEAFPSWNEDSEALAELVEFVSNAVDESSPNYIEPADRIATFDMDGTILCEKAPIYIDWCMTMYRVLDDPTYEPTEEEVDSMEQTRDHAYNLGETFKPEGLSKDDLISTAFAGMTPEEFHSYVVNFADTVDAVGFEGMTYGESFYLPMLEVIEYLKANDFDVWMVSACEREVVRALVEQFDIPFDHVIATDVPYVASGNTAEDPADEYNMGKDEELLLGAPLDEVECGKSGKPIAIAREIGKRPVLAFGNSSGDFSMLNYAEGNTEYNGMGFLVVCDDTEREYGSDEKAAEYYDEIEKEGWTAISMANDWATIYGPGVEKTGLPGYERPAAEKAAAEPTKAPAAPTKAPADPTKAPEASEEDPDEDEEIIVEEDIIIVDEDDEDADAEAAVENGDEDVLSEETVAAILDTLSGIINDMNEEEPAA